MDYLYPRLTKVLSLALDYSIITSMIMIAIQIVDDHPILTEGLYQLLQQETDLHCLPALHSGAQLLASLPAKQPDVLLLDINLPDGSGIDLCKKIKNKYPDVQILMLTMYKKASFIQQVMRNGASGYLLKDSKITEICTAIRQVYKGENYISPAATNVLLDSLTTATKNKSFIPELTRREKQVLQLIAREHTTNEIASSLHISLNTVESHRRNLLHKLNARNAAGLVRIAMEKGLLE